MIKKPTNPAHRCRFGVGINIATRTCTHLTHTQQPMWVMLPMLFTSRILTSSSLLSCSIGINYTNTVHYSETEFISLFYRLWSLDPIFEHQKLIKHLENSRFS